MLRSLFKKKNRLVIRERAKHCISRSNIDPDALKVLCRLANTGHIAYLVGGSVRDLLLGRTPKDFDIGTDASPNQIRRLFRNCFLIGKRFRLAHIVFGRKIIETSTFRRQPESCDSDNGVYQTEDNTFGSPEEDAKRRDFTVNGLFYDIKTFSVIDYVGGLDDLERKTMRCIGDPDIRFREDPVRMMRAVKFAARLDFTIDRCSQKAIFEHHADILNASVPRVCEEVFRLFTYNSSCKAFKLLWEYKLMQDLLPDIHKYVEGSGRHKSILWNYLAALDSMPSDDASVSNGVRMAVLHYPLFLELLNKAEAECPAGRVNRQHVIRMALHSAAHALHIPKATFFTAMTLIDVQRRFTEPPRKGRAQRFATHPVFPEALAFQRILSAAEHSDTSVLDQWRAFYEQAAATRQTRRMDEPGTDEIDEARDAEPESPRRRRRRPRRRKGDRPSSAAFPSGQADTTAAPSKITVKEVADTDHAQ